MRSADGEVYGWTGALTYAIGSTWAWVPMTVAAYLVVSRFPLGGGRVGKHLAINAGLVAGFIVAKAVYAWLSNPLFDQLPPELGSAIIALEMEDHYLRVHTRLGSDLILLRMRDALAELDGLDNVALIEPLDYPHFAHLLSIAEIMLTDSGGVQEEAPALGKPVLVMRETTERPEGVEAGTAKLVGTETARIVTEIFTLLDDKAAYEAMAQAHNPFGDGHSARRIVELLAHEIGSEA